MGQVKIGMVGFFSPNFSARQYAIWPRSVAAVENLARELGFHLRAWPDEIAERDVAAAACQEMCAWGADLVLIQPSSFAMGDLLDPFIQSDRRLGLWAVPEPTGSGPLPLNSLAAFNLYASKLYLSTPQRPPKWFYGNGSEPTFRARLALTVRALATLKMLDGATVGLLGGIAPSFDNLQYDPAAVHARLGVRIEEDTLDEVFARARACSGSRVEQAVLELLAATRQNHLPAQALETSARVFLALRDLAQERNYRALAVSCWPRFQEELHIAPCAAYAMLNQTGLTIADEGDALGAVSMLALSAASDLPTTLMDLVSVDEAGNRVHFWHCGGPTAPSLADSDGAELAFHPTLNRSLTPEAPRYGAAMNLVMRPGPATVMRFSKSAREVFLLAGDIVADPGRGWEGSRGWFGNLRMGGAALNVPDLLETLVCHGVEHHYPIAFADVSGIMAEVAAWLGLRVLPPVPYRAHLQIPA